MKTLKLSDREYKLAEPDQNMYRQLLPFAKSQLVDPLASIRDTLSSFPPKIQEIMVKEAMKQARMPLGIDSPEFLAIMQTVDGAEKLMCLMFQRHQPEMSVDDCWNAHTQAVSELGGNYMEQLSK